MSSFEASEQNQSLPDYNALLEELSKERLINIRLTEQLAAEIVARQKAEEKYQSLSLRHQTLHSQIEREEEGFVNKVI